MLLAAGIYDRLQYDTGSQTSIYQYLLFCLALSELVYSHHEVEDVAMDCQIPWSFHMNS